MTALIREALRKKSPKADGRLQNLQNTYSNAVRRHLVESCARAIRFAGDEADIEEQRPVQPTLDGTGTVPIAKASVPTQVARTLRIGGSAQVRVGDASFAATIRFIGALSDPKTGSVIVDLVLQQATSIASGTLGSVEFIEKAVRKSSENILLPPEALLESKGGVGSVYVLDVTNSVARRTPIKVLGFEGEMIRITGLDKGVKVLTTGAGFVSDGQKVREIRQ